MTHTPAAHTFHHQQASSSPRISPHRKAAQGGSRPVERIRQLAALSGALSSPRSLCCFSGPFLGPASLACFRFCGLSQEDLEPHLAFRQSSPCVLERYLAYPWLLRTLCFARTSPLPFCSVSWGPLRVPALKSDESSGWKPRHPDTTRTCTEPLPRNVGEGICDIL